MRWLLALLAVTAALVTCSGVAKGVGDSQCGNDCGGGGNPTCAVGYQYAGYTDFADVGLNTSSSVNIEDNFDVLNNGGHNAAWIGVVQFNGNTPYNWLQAGLKRDGPAPGTLEFYIEVGSAGGSTIVYHAAASEGVAYAVTLHHGVTSGAWTATVNGNSWTVTNIGSSIEQVTMEEDNFTSTCNTAQFSFSSLSPWATTGYVPQQDNPYYVDSITAHGWISD